MAGNRNIAVVITYNRLNDLASELHAEASRVVRKTARDIEEGAKSIVPVDTGNLKNSIQVKEQEDDLNATIGIHEGSHVEYAAYVEYGTHRMAAQPYLTPAAERARPSFNEAMERLLK